MQRKQISESSEGSFIGCKEESYLKSMQQKARQLGLYDATQLTPKILEQSPYKLHVSLAIDDYPKYKDKIKQIIISSLEDGAINDFKFTSNDIIELKKDRASQLLELIKKYKVLLAENKELDASFRQEIICAVGDYFDIANRDRCMPDAYDIKQIIETLNRAITNHERLLSGDQFTIYIPEQFNENKILNLCKKIDDYLTENTARPGKLLDVESPLGNYINFRQDFLMEDFRMVNDTGYMAMDKRIEAVQLHKDEIEIKRREQVVIEQQNSNLYKYINLNLAKSSNQLNTSPRFYQQVQEEVQEDKKDGVAASLTDGQPKKTL